MTPLEQTLTAQVHAQAAQIQDLQAKLVDQRVSGLEAKLHDLDERVRKIERPPLPDYVTSAPISIPHTSSCALRPFDPLEPLGPSALDAEFMMNQGGGIFGKSNGIFGGES